VASQALLSARVEVLRFAKEAPPFRSSPKIVGTGMILPSLEGR
jgi:hypothetical protein